MGYVVDGMTCMCERVAGRGTGLDTLTTGKRDTCRDLIENGRYREAIGQIITDFGIAVDFADVRYDPTLLINGRTTPAGNIQIGEPAFQGILTHQDFFGISHPALREMRDVAAALTIAHEATHLYQYEEFGYIAVEKLNTGGYKPEEKQVVVKASKAENGVYEMVAYASELVNIAAFTASRANVNAEPGVFAIGQDRTRTLSLMFAQAERRIDDHKPLITAVRLNPANVFDGTIQTLLDRIRAPAIEIDEELYVEPDF